MAHDLRYEATKTAQAGGCWSGAIHPTANGVDRAALPIQAQRVTVARADVLANQAHIMVAAAARARVSSDPSTSPLLLHPLFEASHPRAVFTGTDDPGAMLLSAWISGGGNP